MESCLFLILSRAEVTMACKCVGSKCTCKPKCICAENFDVNCPLHLVNATVSLDSSHSNIQFKSAHAQSHDTETSESSMPDTSDCLTTGNNKDEQIDCLSIIRSEETKLVTEETVLVVKEKLPLNPSHAQSHDTETKSSMPDTSECLTTENNQVKQIDYIEVIPTKETGLIVEKTPLNPSHAKSRTETKEYSGFDTSGWGVVGEIEDYNQAEQKGNLQTNQPSEKTKIDAELTELLNSLNILEDDQISHDPVNSADRVKYYIGLLNQNIKKESLAASKSRSETNVEKNSSITQAANSSSGRSVSGPPQVPFTSVVAERPNVSTPPFPDCSHDSITNQPFMCAPSASVRQKYASPPPVISSQSAKIPSYTDSATRRHSCRFPESAHNMLSTKPAFSKSSENKLSIPITPASEYAMSKGIFPRETGAIMRPTGRILDWLQTMTKNPGSMHSPQDDSVCSALSTSSSPSPMEIAKDATELQNETKSDKDTNSTEPQSAVVASDESSFACSETTAHQGSTNATEPKSAVVVLDESSLLACSETTAHQESTNAAEPKSAVVVPDESSLLACSKTTAHQESTCAEDASSADSENKIIEQSKALEKSLDSCIDAVSNLSTSLKEKLNIGSELKED